MTKEQRQAVRANASAIEWRERILDRIESAYRHSGDSVSGHIPLAKRAARVLEDTDEATADRFLCELRERLERELALMQPPHLSAAWSE